MKISDSEILQAYHDDLGARKHDFYACYKCGRVLTREREKAVWEAAEAGRLPSSGVEICPCGSAKYSPTKPVGFDWLRPSILSYTLKLVLARELAPVLEVHWPAGNILVEYLCRPKEL